MPRYSMLQGLYLAFYSKAFYRDVVHGWKGRGFKYLLILLTVAWFSVFWKASSDMRHVAEVGESALAAGAGGRSYSTIEDQVIASIFSQLPAVTLSAGQAEINNNEPYTIYNITTEDPLVYINTDKNYVPADNIEAPVVITAYRILLQSQGEKENPAVLLDFSMFQQDITFDAGLLLENIKGIGSYLFLSFLAMVAVSFALMALIVWLIAQGLSNLINIENKNVNYQSINRLVAVAMTPLVVLKTLSYFVPLLMFIPLFSLASSLSPLVVLYVIVNKTDIIN